MREQTCGGCGFPVVPVGDPPECPRCHARLRIERSRHPLGLPPGSVRALLTMMLLAVVAVRLVQGVWLGAWEGALLIAMGHYFTSRRMVSLPAELRRKLIADGLLEQDEQPLYLPRNSVRMLIVGVFLFLGVYLALTGQLLAPANLSLVGVATSYLVGMFFRALSPEESLFWKDLKAGGVLLLAGLLATITLLFPEQLSPVYENLALAAVLFYFGSR